MRSGWREGCVVDANGDWGTADCGLRTSSVVAAMTGSEITYQRVALSQHGGQSCHGHPGKQGTAR